MPDIALVSCARKKQSNPIAAKDLYNSDWFLKARTYVEQQGWDWYILSAKYGLLHRDRIIEPYELCLNKLPTKSRRQWAEQVFEQILQVSPQRGTVRVFAGEKYRQHLTILLKEAAYTVEIPLLGLGIGQQLAWFNSHLY
jgi:hypothetical protein